GDKNLDTRNPSGIKVTANTQTVYGNVWRNVLGQYLGNGIRATPSAQRNSSSISLVNTVVNDAKDPAWDFRGGATQAVTSTDAVFFIYDKDNTFEGQADKIVTWVQLPPATSAADEIAAAFDSLPEGE